MARVIIELRLILCHPYPMATTKRATKRAKRKTATSAAEAGVRSAQRWMADFIAKADPESVKKPAKQR